METPISDSVLSPTQDRRLTPQDTQSVVSPTQDQGLTPQDTQDTQSVVSPTQDQGLLSPDTHSAEAPIPESPACDKLGFTHKGPMNGLMTLKETIAMWCIDHPQFTNRLHLVGSYLT